MSLLTIVGVIMMIQLILSIIHFTQNDGKYEKNILWLRDIGLFALILGLFFQMTGLYQAFQAIEMAGSVSPALLAGGLKVSSIPTLFGMLIFLISWIGYFGIISMSQKVGSKSDH